MCSECETADGSLYLSHLDLFSAQKKCLYWHLFGFNIGTSPMLEDFITLNQTIPTIHVQTVSWWIQLSGKSVFVHVSQVCYRVSLSVGIAELLWHQHFLVCIAW